MNIKQVLKNLSLKEVETDVYLAALELGSATASQISLKSKVERTYIYDIAKALQKKGLMSITFQKKKKLFVAKSPDELKKLQEENLKNLQDVLPELKSIQRVPGEKPKISYYEGIDGMETVLLDSMEYKGEIKGFTTSQWLTKADKRFEKKITKIRVERNIPTRFIGPVSKEMQYLQKTDKKYLREIKMLPANLFSSDVEMFTYGKNKLAILNYQQEFAVLIENYDIVHVINQIFELIWRGGFVID